MNIIYALKINNEILIITDTACSIDYCKEFGCDFPNCAISDERFSNEDEAKLKYPNIEYVSCVI